jgi:acetyl-CoA carboxylase carboxyltransferase component
VDIDGYASQDIEKCDGVYAGIAKIKGIRSCVIVQEPDYLAGTMGNKHIRRIIKVANESLRRKIPLLCLYSSGGARFQEGSEALYSVSKLINSLTAVRAKLPYISAVIGPCAGGASISASISDILVMEKNSSLFVYGPLVTNTEFSLDVKGSDLGGAEIQAKNGTASILVEDEEKCVEMVKNIFLTLRGKEESLQNASEIEEKTLASLGMNKVIELFHHTGPNVLAGLTVYRAKPVMILLLKGNYNSGYLGYEDTFKLYRVLELCNRKKIQVFQIVDSAGFAPLPSEESKGLVLLTGKIAELLSARRYRCISLVDGKCFGGLFVLLCSKSFGCDLSLAYSNSIISVAPKKTYYHVAGKGAKFEEKFSAFEAEKKGILKVVKSTSELRDLISLI